MRTLGFSRRLARHDPTRFELLAAGLIDEVCHARSDLRTVPHRPATSGERALSALADRTVLVAEDEFLIALNLEMLLEDAGARVHLAATVGEAVAAAGNGIDVAVLDVSLADGEVFPAADILAARGLPFVFHSGHAATDVLLARYPHARALPKPAHENVLLATLGEMLSEGGA